MITANDIFVDSDLVNVYSTEGNMIGHMWYRTYCNIYGNGNYAHLLEYSDHNGPENIAEYEQHHQH